MKTVIYLDVDGVINSLSGRAPKNNTQWLGEWKRPIVRVHGGNYPILYSEELVQEINKLAEMPDVEIIWLTTWQENAVTILSPILGLNINPPEWEVLYPEHQDDLLDYINWWKLTAIQKDIATRLPDQIVWLDDDLQYDKKAMEWVKNNEDLEILVISPTSVHGLAKRHIRDIIDFIIED